MGSEVTRRSLYKASQDEELNGDTMLSISEDAKSLKYARALFVVATFLSIAIVTYAMYQNMNKVAHPLPKMVQIRKISLVNGALSAAVGVVPYAFLSYKLHGKIWSDKDLEEKYGSLAAVPRPNEP